MLEEMPAHQPKDRHCTRATMLVSADAQIASILIRSLLPKRPMDLPKTPGARKEYNINPQTLAGEINLKKASAILQTPQFGCIFGSILSIALNWIRPGWQEEECSMRIYVARGLPVVVRLIFETISSLDRFNASGYVLPVGRVINMSFELTYPDKPPVEIEIYRSNSALEYSDARGS
jgi:hypothetical protein